MKNRFVVLGAGRQGIAIAYDLAKFGGVGDVVLADKEADVARAGAERINGLLRASVAIGCGVDAEDFKSLVSVTRDSRGVVSALPYRFNVVAAKAAILNKANFCDLGGNTDIVWKELELHKEACAAGVSLIPDCGLAPGTANILGMHAVLMMDKTDEVHIRCGGLPQNPKPPLLYKLVFSFDGLVNEYSGEASFLRNGEICKVPALTDLEGIEFPPPVGLCEAFVTSGGTSTCPWTHRGKVKEYSYKTVRYRGHYEKVKTLFDMGFFDSEPVEVAGGKKVSPRDLARVLFARNSDFPEDRDLIVLRVLAKGMWRGDRVRVTFDMMDFYDEATGFTAMERTTGFSASIVAIHQAKGIISPGAVPLEQAIFPPVFLFDLRQRGIVVAEEVVKM